jgi:hypothetical protein
MKSLREHDDWTDDKVPWPKGYEKWSNVKKSRFRNNYWFNDYWEGIGGCMFSCTCCRYSDGEGDYEWRISQDSELSNHNDGLSAANITCVEVLACRAFWTAVQSVHCNSEKQMRTLAEEHIGNYGQIKK